MMRPPFPDHPFTTCQASALGITRKRLRNAVDQGEVRRVFTGVYARADLPDSTELRASAAGLVMNEHSVLCDRTAAWIHGIDVLRYAELDVIPPLETYVLRGRDPTDRHNCHGGTRDLRPEDWQVIGGLRVTTPLRTALDLACKLRRREAMAALDAFAREFGVTVAQLRRLLVRYFRRRGVVQARELVPLTDGRIESARESWVNLEIHDHALPAPEPQYWVLVDGVPTYRVDFAYPHARVIVEYDGEEFHSKPEKKAADEKRREWLRRNGWRVIVVTKENFDDGPIPSWISELRGYLTV
jgi:Protein of unknown function (DUF559)/Transcriptional regulator, AbiEi antitoxin